MVFEVHKPLSSLIRRAFENGETFPLHIVPRHQKKIARARPLNSPPLPAKKTQIPSSCRPPLDSPQTLLTRVANKAGND